MKLKAVAFAAIPFACVAAGIYILVATPEIVTQTVEYSSSHTGGILLIMLGLIAGLMAALVWDVTR